MRLDYIAPLVDAAVAVLSEITGDVVERGDMKLQNRSSASKDIAAIVNMTGDGDGRIIIEMNKDTALAMAGIMNGAACTELDGLALDTLMELANILVARAVSTLNDRGFSFRITPPLIFMGEGLSFFSNLNLETLSVPLRAGACDFNLNVALRMNAL